MENVEMLEEVDSPWEDGQRLTDSWYGIKKEPEETVPDDGNNLCVQGLLNLENNGYIDTSKEDNETMIFDKEFDKIMEDYVY